MGGFFTRERFGQPQVVAGFMLLAFLAQCLWLVGRGVPPGMVDPEEIYRLERGTALWKHRGVGTTAYDGAKELDSTQRHSVADAVPQPALEDSGYDANHSHLWYVIASAPLLLWPVSLQPENMRDLHRLAAVPYLLFGLLLGASLWYVSRRLFGNAGGYIALAFYCFSPGIVRSSAVWFAEPEVGAAWGAFGVIFTAIAVAHTLYAPREVVLWNWRRIVLLGLSLALAVGSQFSLVILLPVALGFMLYLAPTLRIAAVSIWGVSGGIGLLLLYASYFFDAHAFWRGLTHASFFAIEWRAFAMPAAYHLILAQFGQSCPALVLALPMALVTYIVWPRARYFGNTAPLLIAVLFLALAAGMPHYPGLGFQLIAIPFLFVFVAGVAADLVETRYRQIALAGLWGLLVANAAWNIWELARVGRG